MITKNDNLLGIALAGLVLIAFSLSFVSTAKAADLELGGGDSYLGSADFTSPASYDTYYDGSPSYLGSADFTSPASYGYDSYGGYSNPSSYSSGYMPGFSGGWYLGGGSSGGYGGGGLSNSNTNVNTNTNTCTAGSCNTAINAPTTVTIAGGGGNSYPVYIPTYQQPTVYQQPPVYYPPTPVCNTCGCAGYQPCYRQNAPYVTLAAVPYTGLELGTAGTIAYWGFLVLWCLMAAYLIAVKKVQNKIAAWFTGSKKAVTHTVVSHTPVTHTVETIVVKTTEPQFVGIDPFIASQIARSN